VGSTADRFDSDLVTRKLLFAFSAEWVTFAHARVRP